MNLLVMRGISGCPVNSPIDVITIAAVTPQGWVADLPSSFSCSETLWAIHSHLLFPFDLYDSAIVNDDFDGPKPNPFQGEPDCLLDGLIRLWIRHILIRSGHGVVTPVS